MTERGAASELPGRLAADERQATEAAADETLAPLNEQADALRAELARLRQDLAQAQQDFSVTQAAQLREANEKLVLAALRAETIAERAVSKLGELTRSSQLDVLTSMPNRGLMLDRIESAIAMARRHATHIAVLFVDLDHFKQINDTLGHAVGDGVLQHVARRLRAVVRGSDTISRHGGDEFVVLLGDVTRPSDAGQVATKLLAAVAEAADVDGNVLRVSASVGIAIYPEDGVDAPTLIGRADAAMYRSKRSGPGGFEFHKAKTMGGAGLALPTEDALSRRVTRHAAPPQVRETRLRSLREANEQLLIAALTAQELKAHAEEAHRRQVKFLVMVAHELRNPLAPIRTAAALLNRAGQDEALLGRLQVIIDRQVAHMARLVDDLLDTSRAGAGKFRLERSVVEMSEILGVAVETCRPAMDMRLQVFRVHLPGGPLRVYGDPVRLAQIFSNLLDNASKYTPKGGKITITVAAQPPTLVVKVADSGIGVEADALTGLFELFAQDPRAFAMHDGGLGIGLAVVRDLVEAHSGTVAATSAGKDLGSEFTVTLPLSDEPAAV